VSRVLRTNILCDGSESSLGECRYGGRSNDDDDDDDDDDVHHCTHSSNHVAVSCQQCHTRAARLRRNPILPHNSNSNANTTSGKSRFSSTSYTCVTHSSFIIVFSHHCRAEANSATASIHLLQIAKDCAHLDTLLSFYLDLDPMTLIYEIDWTRCSCILKMNLLAHDFRELEHYRQTQTDRCDRTHCTLHSPVVISML